jgi:hypothetical protein
VRSNSIGLLSRKEFELKLRGSKLFPISKSTTSIERELAEFFWYAFKSGVSILNSFTKASLKGEKKNMSGNWVVQMSI